MKELKEEVSEEAKQRTKNLYTPSHKKYVETESWDNILDEFAKFGKGKLGDWLKENYEVPKRK